MISEDSFHYALENTHVILAPQQRIETFGNTSFHFFLISELMDRTNEVRVRNGKIHAERPQLLTPGNYSHLLLDGFGEKAREFADWIEQHNDRLAVMKYGFHFRKSDVVEQVFSSRIESVITQTQDEVDRREDPLSAIIRGVDDAWEVCLLKFTVDLIQKSAGGNMDDFQQRGLI